MLSCFDKAHQSRTPFVPIILAWQCEPNTASYQGTAGHHEVGYAIYDASHEFDGLLKPRDKFLIRSDFT